MGRELQKRKNRSSISKVRHKPKSKKKVLNDAVIASNWDQSQTLAQNYKRLGLAVKLNKNTGGVERKVADVERERNEEELGDELVINGGRGRGKKERLDLGEEKVERDPETGRILRVVSSSTASARPNPLNDPLNELDSESESETEMFDQHGHSRQSDEHVVEQKTAVVAELEHRASLPEKKYRRNQSEGEKALVEQLLSKYGEDFERMARDTEINYMQRSAGDLKRRVKKWKESGGRVG